MQDLIEQHHAFGAQRLSGLSVSWWILAVFIMLQISLCNTGGSAFWEARCHQDLLVRVANTSTLDQEVLLMGPLQQVQALL